jgi:hypothetical protein
MMRLEPSMLRSACWLLLPWILLSGMPAAGIITRSFLDTPGDVADVEVVGNLAFVADGAAGLRVLDVSDPASPSEIGSLDTPGLATDVEVVGDRAYLADGPGGVRRVRITPAAAPREDGFLATEDPALAIAVGSRYACVALGEAGLLVVDVSGGTLIARASLPARYWVAGVKVAGDLAFVADGDDLRVIDLSRVSAKEGPVQIGVVSSGGGQIGDLELAGSTVWMAAGELYAIDVSDPTNPSRSERWSPDDSVGGVATRGSLAFVAGGDGLYVVDSATRPLTQVNLVGPRDALDVTVSGDLAYVTYYGGGLRLIDVSRPEFPRTLGRLWIEDAWDMEVAGSLAWIAGGGLRAIDLSDPRAPAEIAAHQAWGARDVELAGGLAYVAGPRDLYVIDVSSPTTPVELGSLPLEATRVEVVGSRAYVTSEEPALHVIDVATPSAPAELGALPLPDSSLSVDVVGERVYVAAGEAGLRIIDASDPANLVEIGGYPTMGYTTHVDVSGSLAYLDDSVAGVRLLDVSDPTFPIDLGRLRAASTFEVHGRLAYAFGGSFSGSGLRVFDVSAAPSLLEILYFPDLLPPFEPAGRFLYSVTDGEFRVLDLGPEYVPEPAQTLLSVLALSAAAWLACRRLPPSADPG